jgi:hypothetical protein
MISGALTLLTNTVIAYNTWKLHQVLERYLRSPATVISSLPEDRRRRVMTYPRETVIFGRFR